MKSSFFERLGAYFLDLIIIGLITSIITYAIPISESTLDDRIEELATKIQKNEITREAYLEEYESLLYDSQVENYQDNILGLIITFAYFIIFQFLNKGRTIGKQLLKLKIENKKDKKPPSFISIFLRSLIPYGILSTTIYIFLLHMVSKATYLKVYYIVGSIETLFILITATMIILNKDGLHDLIGGTTVVKDERR